MLKNLVKMIGGDPNAREIERLAEIAEGVNDLEEQFEALSDEELRAKTDEFRSRLKDGETRDDIMVEAYAVVREVSKRTIGQRHYDVQVIGGIVLHLGRIAEMRTGEGKTLLSTLPLYLNGLSGEGTHLITVNDYLARRDARWMAPIFNMLGLSVGVLQMAARTENGKKAFLVDLEKSSSQEDLHQLVMVDRRLAYEADITYGTNNEFGFDYLRDNMKMSLEERSQRGHHYAIIDEVDNVLIDEARTPLIISGPSHDDTGTYSQMAQVVRKMRPEDFEVSEKDRTVTMTEIGETHVEQLIGQTLRDPERPEDITPEQARLMGHLEQALRAQFLFRRNKDYLVQGGKVVIVDVHTGRLMPGRRWSDGLHQAVEAKEGVRIEPENVTYATVTIQNYFRMYDKLAGMTGTALTEAEEFDNIYSLEVLAIPPRLDYQAMKPDSTLDILEGKDEYGYKYTYYAQKEDPSQLPALWKRKDYPDMIYRTVEAKLRAIVQEILVYHVIGRPQLVGTTSVENSEVLSSRLKAESVRKLAQILLIRDLWMEQNDQVGEVRIIPELAPLNAPLEKIRTPELRNLSRDLGMSLNPESEENVTRLLSLLGLAAEHQERLVKALKGGVPQQVLNARRHTEESQIIAGAGAFGAVTIATNMAGRGVDIKLGGDMAEEVLSAVNRILRRAGQENPYNMSLDERRQAILALTPDQYGIYSSEIKYFLKYFEYMEKVKEVGGLHVLGSERHEARRIDNQLRGRAARQGDPGSSRFYLSMEDDLMRLFGGQQVDNLMQRLKMDDAIPLEHGLVGRIIEQSQTRVEGANFDARKHLLEYDDVLNTQRINIYHQRDRIFGKDDLSEDVTEMLQTEISQRAPLSLEDEEGPWKLLAWLDQIQPPIQFEGQAYPSFTLRLLMDHINAQAGMDDAQAVKKAILEVAGGAIEAEEEHFLNSITNLLDLTQDRLKNTLEERLELLDLFFEGLQMADETDTRSPQDLVNELSGLLRVNLRMDKKTQLLLREDPGELEDSLYEQVETMLTMQATVRLIGAAERTLQESLALKPDQLPSDDWDAIEDTLVSAIQGVYAKRRERLVGERMDGQIAKEIDAALSKVEGQITEDHLVAVLQNILQGSRTTFDRKTHQRIQVTSRRLTYVYYAAQFIEGQPSEEVAERALLHLEAAQEFLRQTWGQVEWRRLSEVSLSSLDEEVRAGLESAVGEAALDSLGEGRLDGLPPDEMEVAIDELGRQTLTRLYRQLLLSVISNLWVEYLTQMEALRVSIRLEAYGQRDPLVQYKSKAYEMFQTLLSDMRMGVITRMFIFRPRDPKSVQASVNREAIPARSGDGAGGKDGGQPKKKRKRRRKRKR